MSDPYEIGAALVQQMKRQIHHASATGRIAHVTEGVFLITDPELVAALRFYFEKELTFQGIDVLGTRAKERKS